MAFAVTFHRAFDEVRDQRKALDVLLGFDAVTNVLTSGTQPSVLNAEATIRALVRQAAGSHCPVLAGTGLTVDAVAGFVSRTQVQAVHFARACVWAATDLRRSTSTKLRESGHC